MAPIAFSHFRALLRRACHATIDAITTLPLADSAIMLDPRYALRHAIFRYYFVRHTPAALPSSYFACLMLLR